MLKEVNLLDHASPLDHSSTPDQPQQAESAPMLQNQAPGPAH